jgi:hypothetical protein
VDTHGRSAATWLRDEEAEPRQDARRRGEADWVHDVCLSWPADQKEEDR